MLRDITERLDTLRIDGPPVFDEVLRELRCLMEVELLGVYRPRKLPEGWELDLSHLDSHEPTDLKRRFETFIAQSDAPFAAFDPTHPEAAQRNRLLSSEELGENCDERPLFRDVYTHLRLERFTQSRILLCEGPSLLAWFGAIHQDPLDARQGRILSAVAPALRRRLSVERRLRDAPRAFAALDVALEQLGAPALVVGPKGQIQEANSAARRLIEEDERGFGQALRDAIAGRPSTLSFEFVPIAEPGASCSLAILSGDSKDTRITERVANAAESWNLTPRQREVLALVARGAANAVIAQSLGIAERTVEFHIGCLFDRAGVEFRAALTAAVLARR